jgi:hypothetical protein
MLKKIVRKVLFVFLLVVSSMLLFNVSRFDTGAVIVEEDNNYCNDNDSDWKDEYPPCPFMECIPYQDDAFWDEPVPEGGQKIVCANNCTWYNGWCCRILSCNCGTSSDPCWRESPAYADCDALCAELGQDCEGY